MLCGGIDKSANEGLAADFFGSKNSEHYYLYHRWQCVGRTELWLCSSSICGYADHQLVWYFDIPAYLSQGK